MDFNLVRDVNDNKKGFYKYISNKRKNRENVGLLLNNMRTQLRRTRKKLSCRMPSLPHSLLARLTFRNYRSQRPGRMPGARKMYSGGKRINQGTLKQT